MAEAAPMESMVAASVKGLFHQVLVVQPVLLSCDWWRIGGFFSSSSVLVRVVS